MAIGVSYMGHDGRRADFTTEGNPTPGSALDQLVRGGTGGNPLTPLAEQMRRARRPQAPDPRTDKAAGTVRLSEADRRPGTLMEKMKRGGSVVASENGVCLKGEEQVAGNGVYAKHGEKQGFLTLDEIDDPNAKGGVVGEADSQNRLTPSNKTSSDKEGAFGVNMQSRTEAEVNEETGEVTFWEYTKRLDVTSGRRVGEVGGETKRKICSFFLGGERQITIGGPRFPFTVMRSNFKDENGKTQYEFWVKCLKWGIEQVPNFYTDYTYIKANCFFVGARNLNYNHYFNIPISGTYPFGEYGDYPRRPSNRPRLLRFDSKRYALADLFEERSLDVALGNNCNCWTYVGSSVEGVFGGHADGNFDLYGCIYTYAYDNITPSDPYRMFVLDEDILKDGQSKLECITNFLESRNSLFRLLPQKPYTSSNTDKSLWSDNYIRYFKICSVKDWEIVDVPLYVMFDYNNMINIVHEIKNGDVDDFYRFGYGRNYKVEGKKFKLSEDVVVTGNLEVL